MSDLCEKNCSSESTGLERESERQRMCQNRTEWEIERVNVGVRVGAMALVRIIIAVNLMVIAKLKAIARTGFMRASTILVVTGQEE